MAMHRNQSSASDPVLHPVLVPENLAYLEERGITPEAARVERLASLTKHQIAQIFGWQKPGSSGGLGILFPPERNQDDYWCVRLDTPFEGRDGGMTRFIRPKGRLVRPYLPRCVEEAFWRDHTKPVCIVEGAIKAISLASNGIPAIGLGGITTGHDSIYRKQTGKLRLNPELLQKVVWRDRLVTIVFDAGRATNEKVMRAERQLYRALTLAGAIVQVAELPLREGPEDPKERDQGPDDFLADHGVEAMRALIARARPGDEVHDPHAEITRRLARKANGGPLGNAANATLILDLDPRWDEIVAFDEFRQEVVFLDTPPWDEEYAPSVPVRRGDPWSDTDDTRLSAWFSRHWNIELKDTACAAVIQVMAKRRLFHPVRDYLYSLTWDGKERLGTWLTTYLGAPTNDFTKMVGTFWMISGVARIVKPGCKADYMLVFEGRQGKKKSMAARVLAGDNLLSGRSFFSDAQIDMHSKDGAIALHGVWIQELGELSDVTKREVEVVKGFLSRQVDHYRPAYGRRAVDVPRQTIFIGTTNEGAYLKDSTGGRRFWCIETGIIDIEALKRDRDQLWAEALHRLEEGERWYPDDESEHELAAAEVEKRYVGDAWEEEISAYLASPAKEHESFISSRDLLTKVLDIPIGKATSSESQRVGRIMLNVFHWKNGRAPTELNPDRPRGYLRTATSLPALRKTTPPTPAPAPAPKPESALDVF